MNLTVQATGVTAAGERVKGIDARAGDPRPVFGGIVDEFTAAERRLFSSGRGIAPLKPATIARKLRDPDPRVRANANRRNVATGRLQHFLTTRGVSEQPLRLDRREVMFGIPPGRSAVYYGRALAAHDRSPVVPARTVRRVASPRIKAWLMGARS